MPTVALFNLGCSKNLIDGERILHFCNQAGITTSDNPSQADILIVNTCAFIREAQEEAIETILSAAELKKKNKNATLIVSGCFSERFRKRVAGEFPEVDIWAGVHDWENVLRNRITSPSLSPFKRTLSEPYATQYIKIADGCSHRCSFCVIPSIRGPFKSRPIASIIEETQWLEAKGVKELILVAQDTSYYGRDIGQSLTTLLERILACSTIPWIRLMYLHPQYVDASLLELIAHEKRICPYFDIPLQHSADSILCSMRRRPLSKGLYHLIDRIRSTVPDAVLRSAFIVGYPGETERDFKALIQFIESVRFDKVGAFPYSPEEGTPAEKLRPRPRNATALRRCETLMLVQRDISREKNESYIGRTIEVIIDRLADDPDFNFEARTRFDAPEVDGKVLIGNGSFDIGTITSVQIIGSTDYDLFAEIPLNTK